MELQRQETRGRPREFERMVDNAKRASDFLKALAHESRLVILCILAEGEKSVSELEHDSTLRQPTVSQQLARLRADGLVSTRRDGKAIYYSLASSEARVMIDVIYDVFCNEAASARAIASLDRQPQRLDHLAPLLDLGREIALRLRLRCPRSDRSR